MTGNGITVGVDIGGTFTDLVLVNASGSVRVAKVASTPPHYGNGVVEGLAKLGVATPAISRFAHGTTTAINAILTKTGASTGLLTTKGFRDVLEIRRGDRDEMYNYWWRPAEPLVPRYNRLEARERIAFDGRVVQPLVEDDIRDAVEMFRARGIESVAICFLNSFVNGDNERRAKAIIEELWPEAYVCASVDIMPEILEFERTSTTVANAYVGPILEGYLAELGERLRDSGLENDLLIMSSSGSVMTIETALDVPISTAMSGIAAGAMAGAAISRDAGRPNLITLDVGGTSSDIALIIDSQPRLTTEWFIEFGVPIGLPSIDIRSIGAGGGSIAEVDAGGVLNVGPESAGANPGPACYGRGGDRPTTTDAQVLLGRLDLPRWKQLYGWSLDVEAAERVLRRSVAEPLELPVIEAAEAVLEVMVNNLVEAIRLVTIERGYDPRLFTLAAFGGAGPMYAVEIARRLTIPDVIVPVAPGVTSALGLLQVDVAVRTQRSVLMPEDAIDAGTVSRLFDEMEGDLRTKLTESGYGDVRIKRQIDVRYFGQSRYVTVSAPAGTWDGAATQAVMDEFTREHEREHGYTMPPEITKIEFANLRILAEAPIEQARLAFEPSGEPELGTRHTYFKDTGFVDVPVFNRAGLSPALPVTGPAIVEQVDSTLILPPGSKAVTLPGGDLLVTV